MGIRKWRDHKGRQRIYLSRQWPDGTRFRRVMPTMTAARNTEARIAESIAMGTWPSLQEELRRGPDDDPTLAEFASVYLDEYCATRNRCVSFKRDALKPVVRILGRRPVKELSRADAHEFVKRRSKEVAPATVNRGLAVLRHLLTFAVDKEVVAHNPLYRFRLAPEQPRGLRILTLEEFHSLVAAVTAVDAVVGAYVAVLGETGLRKAEGLNLRWSDIDLARRKLTVRESKSGLPRYVPLTEFALGALRGLVRVLNNPSVFVRPDTGKQWRDPRGPFKKGCAQAGLDWVKGFHDLRHYRATQWLRNGVDLRTVKELLGHGDITTTMRYVHYVQEHAERIVREAEFRERGGRKLDGA